MLNWMKLSDQYFQWWQEASSRCVDSFKKQPSFLKGWGGFLDQSLQFKQMADQAMDEMWHNFRLPSRKEVGRLHERINHLESLLAELRERDWAEELDDRILKKGKVASPEDLKSLEKTWKELEKHIAGAAELGLVKEAVTQMEAKLDSLTEEAERIKEMLAQSGSKLDALSAAPKQPAKKPAKRTSGGAR
jgi:polyhydroxyalkanoate synthesis regulator phasin